jgi:signal transduction histidine kinase
VATRQLDILEEEVRGLLALGRPGETATGPVDVAALVAEVKDLAGPRSEHAGVRLETDLPARLPPLTGRREALRAALVNLALNAIDAVGRDGRVRIQTTLANGCLELAVEDDGPGPPAELAESLTEPFVTGKQEGIGLGLAVAKAVAEEHGGRLSWSRTHGRTRFVIALPLPAGHPSRPDSDS